MRKLILCLMMMSTGALAAIPGNSIPQKGTWCAAVGYYAAADKSNNVSSAASTMYFGFMSYLSAYSSVDDKYEAKGKAYTEANIKSSNFDKINTTIDKCNAYYMSLPR